MPGAASGQRPVEFVQEGQDLDVAFPWRTPGEDGPIEDVEGREQIGRSHTNTAHANLMQALPNCVKVGFTGTPIIMRDKGQTAKIFGDFIDRYTIRESEADGATVPILYEGRTTGAAVKGGGQLDEVFEDMLADRTPEELEVIKQKYATRGHVMEATALIAAKARNMLRHYVENILPNGFKAQVVAVSRRATIRYRDAFCVAQEELVADLEALHPNLLGLADEAIDKLDSSKAFLLRAHRFLPTIKALEFAPVISGTHNDAVDPAGEWTTRSKVDARIARFKMPLFAAQASLGVLASSPLARAGTRSSCSAR